MIGKRNWNRPWRAWHTPTVNWRWPAKGWPHCGLIAEEAQKAKTAFVANVSHELRTPLNMIIGLVDLMVETPAIYDVVLSPKMREDLRSYTATVSTSPTWSTTFWTSRGSRQTAWCFTGNELT